jgi:hypothetical protein
MRIALALSLLLAACGSRAERVETTTSVVVVESAPQTNGTTGELPAHTLWQGRYLCAQGPTALTLTLDLSPDGRAAAVFDFGPLPENPTVPNGRYLVDGTAFRHPDGAVDVALRPDRWITQPPDYVMVGLVVAIDAPGRAGRGRIDQPDCGAVELARVQ